ncbi:class I SAM-dependent methyltransferase [candidate division WOR-3 bacterium]|nr:class I SAM-dependent methyltransferase [candidate division WOR-3 bacterium]
MPDRANLVAEVHEGLLQAGPARLEFTRRAYQMIPRQSRPRILDVGCGEGGPTLELARQSGGEVVGLDIHRPSLERLRKRIDEAGLSDRVRVEVCSMLAMDFPDEMFDIIWSEGSIHIIGFEQGLGAWRRFVKSAGFMAVHEGIRPQGHLPPEMRERWHGAYQNIKTAGEYIEAIAAQGYVLVGQFRVPADVWWSEYFAPLAKRIRMLRERHADDAEACAVLDREEAEIVLFKKYPDWYGSSFFVMQKKPEDAALHNAR